MTVTQTKFRTATKIILACILGFVALMQIEGFSALVAPMIAANPVIASCVAALISIGTLLMNPVVQKILHIQDEIEEIQNENKQTEQNPPAV